MPRIPEHGLQKVEQRPVNVNVRNRPILQQPDTTLVDIGSAVFDIYEKKRRETDTLLLQEAATKINEIDRAEALEAEKIKGVDFLKPGDDGLIPYDRHVTKRNQRVDQEVIDKLPSRELQDMVRIMKGRGEVSFKKNLDAHLLTQEDVAKTSVANAANLERMNHIVSMPTDDEGFRQRNETYLASVAHKFKGKPEEWKAFQAKTTADGYIARTEQILEKSPSAAEKFFQANKDTMRFSPAYSDVELKIVEGVRTAKAIDFVDQVQTLPLAEQQAKIREAFKDDKRLVQMADAEARSRYSANREAYEREQDSLMGDAMELHRPLLPGKSGISPSAVTRTETWRKLSKENRQKLWDYWDRLSDEAKRERMRKEEDPDTWFERQMLYRKLTEDPIALMNMSEGEILSMREPLGGRLTVELVDDKRKFGEDIDKMESIYLSKVPWKEIAHTYGIKSKGTLSPKDESRLEGLRKVIIDEMRSVVTLTGKAVPQKDALEIIHRNSKHYTLQERPFFLPDVKARPFELTNEMIRENFTEEEVTKVFETIETKIKALHPTKREAARRLLTLPSRILSDLTAQREEKKRQRVGELNR